MSCPIEPSKDEGKPAKPDALMDPSTFTFPTLVGFPTMTIEFCDRCRWLHRATWVQTELFVTFPTPIIGSISLIPLSMDETAGRFRIWLSIPGNEPRLMWDRKVEGGFPELKILKQRIRDILKPGMSLGHSDRKSGEL